METRPSEEHTFFLFVYGTLKCGYSNHDAFCKDALNIEKASVGGDLYDLPFGFPALVVAEDTVLAAGTRDPAYDVATQHTLNRKPVVPLRDESPRVFGELFTLQSPGDRLPKLDHLEGFDPEGQSLYRRVLIPVETGARNILAWTYTIEKPTGTRLPDGRWPV